MHGEHENNKIRSLIVVSCVLVTLMFFINDLEKTTTITSSTSTVSSSDLQVPWLANAMVNPQVSDNMSVYNFTCNYFDADNELPVSISVEINATGTFSMVESNPADTNVTDGKLYWYATLLAWGSYRFNMSAFDGNFTNSTGWIQGPEVNPFLSTSVGGSGIVINEVSLGDPDAIELYNYGPDQLMTGWSIRTYDSNLLDITYSIPAGFTLASNSFVTIRDGSGTNTPTALYTGGNIYWYDRPTACGLFNNAGANMDWWEANNHVTPFPADAEWTDDITLIVNNVYAYRASDEDTDKASDWTVSASGTLGALNPGQTGITYQDFRPTLLGPPNGTSLYSGSIAFSWTSLLVPFSPVNFTWQLSSTPDFLSIINETTGIGENTTVTTNTTIAVDVPTGMYYWRVKPVYGPFSGNFSYPFMLNITRDAYPPALTLPTVNPSSGNQHTMFNFSVLYTNLDDAPPVSMALVLNGTSYDVFKVDPGDYNYTDGVAYQRIMKLFPGSYTYSFNCNDGVFTNSTGVSTLTVTKANIYAPSITNVVVSPVAGVNTTVFTFEADYLDLDGDLPQNINITVSGLGTFPMVEDDPLDMNVTDGKHYLFTTTLNWGYYWFQVNCSDTLFSNASAVVNAPEVNPFLTLGETTGEITNVAIFQNSNPWGYASIQTILTAAGISFTIYPSSSLGAVSLASYDKVVIPSDQDFYSTVSTAPIRSWLEAYVSGGGVLEFHAVTGGWVAPAVSLYGLPGGFDSIWSSSDTLTINASLATNPMVDGITNTEIDGWGTSAHNYIQNLLPGTATVIYRDGDMQPALLVSRYGSGYFIYTGMTLEYGYGTSRSNILRNVLLYDPVPSYSSNLSLVSPENETTLYNGVTTFTWTSFEPWFGAITYTWQLSNSSDFAFIIQENASIPEVPGFTSFETNISMPGLYWWRVCGIYEGISSNWSDPFTFTLEVNDVAPTLSGGSFGPPVPDQLAPVTFYVLYTDGENNVPHNVTVTINGTIFVMVKGNTSDNDYTDGCWFNLSASLVPGQYNYTFGTSDGRWDVTTSLYSNLTVIEVNLQVPWFQDTGVTPLAGTNTTLFTFTTTYFDADNNSARSINITINGTSIPMLEVDPLDTDVSDGKLFTYSTILSWGYYQFQVSAYDGGFLNSTGWILAPEVNPFDTLHAGQIMINELSNSPDYIELINLGGDQDMTGWRLYEWIGSTLENIYTFPSGWVFKSGYIVTILEYSGTNTDTTLYLGTGIGWVSTSTFAVGLYDNTNQHVDWVESASFTQSPPYPVVWTEDISLNFNSFYSAYRTSDIDRDLASDWTWGAGSMGALNPGQSGVTSTSTTITLLSPANGSLIFNGLENFTWASLEPWFGPIIYTWHLSNTTDFSAILQENSSIPETAGFTSIAVNLSTPGVYWWRVRGVYDGIPSNWSVTFMFTLETNDVAPTLTGASFEPLLPNQLAPVIFSALYTDSENNAPHNVTVTVNGTVNMMVKGNLSDNDYTDGCWFNFSLWLIPGSYNYSFGSSDGRWDVLTPSYANLTVIEANFDVPWLESVAVTPLSSGSDATVFTFTAVYFDADNNSVQAINVTIFGLGVFSMVESDPSDTNLVDGKAFEYSTVLDWGYHSFQVNCSDYGFSNWSVVINAPEVNPFLVVSSDSILAIQPGNNTLVFNGATTFRWSNLNMAAGAVEYAIQVSGSPAFLTIAHEVTGIPELAGSSTFVLISLDDVPGTYYWRVQPSFGVFDGSWSSVFVYNFQVNDHVPVLSVGQVNPATGTEMTTFTFAVTYTDADNNAPVHVSVVIDGVTYAMAKQTPSDITYTDGCVYIKGRTLNPDLHAYHFTCSDGRYVFNTTTRELYVNSSFGYIPFVVVKPSNMTVKSGAFLTLSWMLNDDQGSGQYQLYRDGVPVGDGGNWTALVGFSIVVDTKLFPGEHRFTLEFWDTSGNLGNESTVLVTITYPGGGLAYLFEQYTLLMVLVIGGCVAIAVTLVVVRAKKVSKVKPKAVPSLPKKKAPVFTYQEPPGTEMSAPLPPVPGTVAQATQRLHGTHEFMCSRCFKAYRVAEPDIETWYSCIECGNLLEYFKTCPVCGQKISISRERMHALKQGMISCPNCAGTLHI